MSEKKDERRVPRIKDRVTKPYEKPRIIASRRNNEEILWISPTKAPSGKR